MDICSHIVESFVGLLFSEKARVPHKNIRLLASHLLVMIDILKGICGYKEIYLLEDLLNNLLTIESKFSGQSGVTFLHSIMNNICFLLNQVTEKLKDIRTTENELQKFRCCIDQLQSLLLAIQDSVAKSNTATNVDDNDFQAVCSNDNYIAHYIARHEDFIGSVVVVLWKFGIPGPTILHDGMPLLYVHHPTPSQEPLEAWPDAEPLVPVTPRQYTSTELNEAARVREVISRNQKRLFANHSNLVGIRLSDFVGEDMKIEFIVLCKHFIPIIDRDILPTQIEGIPSCVRSGYVELCGREELAFHRPLLPGAGFAVGDGAYFNLDVNEIDFSPPVLGTMGGYYFDQGNMYGVTCAHCIREVGGDELYSKDTPVYQPSAMGLIFHSETYNLGRIDNYQHLIKLKEKKGAMQWLLEHLDIQPDFSKIHEIGVIQGAVLGPLANADRVVDVALVKLADFNVLPTCISSYSFPGLTSPPLVINDSTRNILDAENYPPNLFAVYGRGASVN